MEHLCYVVIRGNKQGERIGIVKFGESGYYVTDYDHHPAGSEGVTKCKEHVRLINKRLGISHDVEDAMLYGSMFGWHVIAAIPAVRHFEQVERESKAIA